MHKRVASNGAPEPPDPDTELSEVVRGVREVKKFLRGTLTQSGQRQNEYVQVLEEFDRARSAHLNEKVITALRSLLTLKHEMQDMRKTFQQTTVFVMHTMDRLAYDVANQGVQYAESEVVQCRTTHRRKYKKMKQRLEREKAVTQATVETLKLSLQEQLSEITALTSENTLLHEKALQASDEQQRLEDEKVELAFVAEELQAKTVELKADLQNALNNIQELKNEVKRVHQVEANLTQQMATLKTERDELAWLAEELHNYSESSMLGLRQAQRTIESLQTDTAAWKSKAESAKHAEDMYLLRVQTLEHELKTLKKQHTDMKDQLSAAKAELSGARRIVDALDKGVDVPDQALTEADFDDNNALAAQRYISMSKKELLDQRSLLVAHVKKLTHRLSTLEHQLGTERQQHAHRDMDAGRVSAVLTMLSEREWQLRASFAQAIMAQQQLQHAPPLAVSTALTPRASQSQMNLSAVAASGRAPLSRANSQSRLDGLSASRPAAQLPTLQQLRAGVPLPPIPGGGGGSGGDAGGMSPPPQVAHRFLMSSDDEEENGNAGNAQSVRQKLEPRDALGNSNKLGLTAPRTNYGVRWAIDPP